MKNSLRALIAVGAVAALAAPASAQDITSITANWANQVPGVNTVDNSNPNDIRVCWTGAPADCSGLGSPGLSGYGFNRAGTPFTPGVGNPFALGTFTHYNYPINLTNVLTSVDLQLNYTVAGSNIADSWTLFHEETPNTAPCAYAGGDPCADRVSFQLTTGGGPNPFSFNGHNYVITLLGFGNTAAEAALNPAYITLEGQTNTTSLWAQIEEVPSNTVPEPATMTLLATGLMGMAAAGRKRR